ncbi:hypothetical protein [Oceanidesulfovibrio indonesiensis]|uniref:hypothetical protein n=1 Tax=Oceanidesulfovibrio indonesiensis TaxID=54767 RepID=UPI00142F91E2|nr:hypothetical protein [Oceanidesulfovibrio indonesiensis]
MKAKMMVFCIVAALVVSGLTGCYQMGKATGETKRAVKESVRDFKKGYHQGEQE